MKKTAIVTLSLIALLGCTSGKQNNKITKKLYNTPFPLKKGNIELDRKLSSAIQRSFHYYEAPRMLDNELYSNFKYTELKGFDYNNGDGTLTRRDPSKIILENGKYYMWYTHRETSTPPQGFAKANDTIPSKDWDLAEIWYATSTDGFTWKEQGVAIARPKKPKPGWRSVATADILKWKDKYYLYYQAFEAPSGKYNEFKDAYDICPVAMSYADSPEGPWTPLDQVVIPYGEPNDWDWRVIHDPSPFVHNGKIYLYYKTGMDQRDANGKHWDVWGVAIADKPAGPFKKHALNPVMNSGHETILFPFKEGIGALVTTDGIEHYTIQYAKDWINFEIASVTTLLPTAAGPYNPDAFTDNPNADGISWGISHFINAGGDWKNLYSILGRFDCDLSQSINDPSMKKSDVLLPKEVYFSQGLSKSQRKRIEGK